MRVLTSCYDGTAGVWDARTGERLVTLLGHEGPVYEARFTGRSGLRAGTVGKDGTARVWDAGRVEPPSYWLGGRGAMQGGATAESRGRTVAAADRGHTAAVRAAAFSPDGELIATAGADRTALLWGRDAGRWRVLRRGVLEGHAAPLTALAFSPDGRCLATASWDRTARIWDVATGRPLGPPLDHAAAVNALTFSPGAGRYLLTAARDNRMHSWYARSGRPAGDAWPGAAERLLPSAFSPDGSMLVTPSAGVLRVGGAERPAGVPEGSVRVWILPPDEGPGSKWTAEKGWRRGDSAVSDAVFSPDGGLVAAADAAGSVRVWEAPESGGPTLRAGPLEHFAGVERLAFSPDGRRLATESEEGLGRIWTLGDPKAGPLVIDGLTGPVPDLAFSPDGGSLLTNGWLITDTGDGVARIWDFEGKRPVTLRGQRDAILALAFGRDGGSILSINHENRAQTWAPDGEPRSLHRGPDYRATCAAICPDGARAVTGGADGTVQLWDPRKRRRVAGLKGHTDRVVRAAFSPDGALVVTASHDRTARIWRAKAADRPGAEPAELLATLVHDQPVNAAGFDRDGRRVVTACGDLERAYSGRAAAGTLVRTSGREAPRRGPLESTFRFQATSDQDAERRGLNAANFAPDGRHVLLACGDNVARIVALDARDEEIELRGHGEPVLDATFSPDGARVVTASADNTARIWDAGGGRTLVVLRGHSGDVSSAAFSNDGRSVVTVSRQDGTSRVWDAERGEVLYVLAARESGYNSATLGDPPGGRQFTDDVKEALFSPVANDRRIVTANGDGVARVYTLDLCGSLDTLIELAERRIGQAAGLSKGPERIDPSGAAMGSPPR